MAPVAPVHDEGMSRSNDDVKPVTGALAVASKLFNMQPLTYNTPTITKEQVSICCSAWHTQCAALACQADNNESYDGSSVSLVSGMLLVLLCHGHTWSQPWSISVLLLLLLLLLSGSWRNHDGALQGTKRRRRDHWIRGLLPKGMFTIQTLHTLHGAPSPRNMLLSTPITQAQSHTCSMLGEHV
jgi:hypothetical protein